jgi:hypothetical protein
MGRRLVGIARGHHVESVERVQGAGCGSGAQAQPGGTAQEVKAIDLAGTQLGGKSLQLIHGSLPPESVESVTMKGKSVALLMTCEHGPFTLLAHG